MILALSPAAAVLPGTPHCLRSKRPGLAALPSPCLCASDGRARIAGAPQGCGARGLQFGPAVLLGNGLLRRLRTALLLRTKAQLALRSKSKRDNVIFSQRCTALPIRVPALLLRSQAQGAELILPSPAIRCPASAWPPAAQQQKRGFHLSKPCEGPL
jgi:hypothetical protein